MWKTRTYGKFQREVSTDAIISSHYDKKNDRADLIKSYKIKLIKGFDDWYSQEQILAILDLIWALEDDWIFDKDDSLLHTTYTLGNKDITLTPSTHYDPINHPTVLYSNWNVIPCQSGITGQWGNE